jgi:hypothetical protein
MVVDVLQADIRRGRMTRCIALESPTRIGMSQPGITTRASPRDERLPQTHGRPGRRVEASTTRDQRRAVPLPQVAPVPGIRAVAPMAPIAERVRAIAAAIQMDRAEATGRTAAGAFQVQVRVRAATQIAHAPAAEDSAAAAGLQAAAVERARSAAAAEAARARPEAAVAVAGGNRSGRPDGGHPNRS